MRPLTKACLALLLAAMALAPALAAPQEEGKRIALIIGNNSYSMSPLKNAVNDARLVDKALQAAGFRTILRENATKSAIEEAAADFLSQLGPDDTALFFYAGHGVQIENENFLVPVDFEAASSVIQAKFRCFSVAQLLDALKNRPKRSIVILDACRSNPVATALAFQAGLAQPQNAGRETYLAYSTGPGQVAADNPNGRNSWFSEALADEIGKPVETLEEVFTRVRSRVSSETEGRQTPWSTSNLTTRFYFHAPAGNQSDTDLTMAQKWMQDARQREQREDWDAAIELVNRVLQRSPGGTLESAARARLPYLEARRDAQARYDHRDFPKAAGLYDLALSKDPFAIDTAFGSVECYLLADQIPEAVRVLKSIRLRGAASAIEKANLMLKELSVVSPEAGAELAAAIPAPPSAAELFAGAQFGVPDWNAAGAYLQSTPVEIAHWTREVTAAYPPPAPPAAPPLEAAQFDKDMFHVEVVPEADTRDISIRRLNAKPEDLSKLTLEGPTGATPVTLNGLVEAQQVPCTLSLPPGKYSIRTLDHGKVIDQQDVQLVATGAQTVTVKR